MSNELGWEIVGSGAETEIVQTDCETSYEEAKRSAIEKIRSVLEPLAQRLAEVENDVDLERNKVPSYKAWLCGSTLVVARTKKRAAELVGDTRSTFSRWHTQCGGHWWYQFALTEGVWERNGNGVSMEWKKSLSWEERRQAAWEEANVAES